jgi:hypothetical protein
MDPASTPTLVQSALDAHNNKHVLEGRKKFCSTVDQYLFDYKHNHPNTIVNCSTVLIKIFGNVVDHPEDDKFRRIKASSNVFKNNILLLRGGEELMVLAGWLQKVLYVCVLYSIVKHSPPQSRSHTPPLLVPPCTAGRGHGEVLGL